MANMASLFLFFLSALIIYFACEFFVNSIEWLGHRLNLSATATGTVLAALGTALPESAVTFMAIVFGKTVEQKNIGIGAAMGGPLVLATLGYALLGIALRLKKNPGFSNCVLKQVNQTRLAADQLWFMAIFVFKLLLGLVVFSGKAGLSLFFLAAYILYIKKELQTQPCDAHAYTLEPLKFRPSESRPGWIWIGIQTLIALIFIAGASHILVSQIEQLGQAIHLPAHVAALLLAPVATELPEILNALIWIRQGKQSLAFANISGSMMIQATIPSALGIWLTPWHLEVALIVAGEVTLLSIAWLWWRFREEKITVLGLVIPASLYLLFALFLIWRFYA